jgi:hypothetical protein
MGHNINCANWRWRGKVMESTKESKVYLIHNKGNFFKIIHTMPIQSEDVGEKILL